MSTIPGVSSSTTSTTSSTSAQSLGQDQFLTLLVAQLQNQDPLNPTDATEFTSQLAQYSQLEQLFNLNDAMDELATTTTKSQSISALNLMGQDVVVEGDSIAFTGEPVDIGYKIDGSVSSATVTITNSAGKNVATISADELAEGNHFLSWDGKDAGGESVTAGKYTFTVNATSGDSSATVTPLVRTTVTGVDLSGSEPQITTNSGSYGLSLIYGAYSTDSASASSQ
ncbi:MAG: flagellar hook capping FlgD N-terminal domain-containing protein [Desulfobulbus sp.]|nr:flagellar hook capping FlgD N-terminal domain-containing protein [Desulfobulbus sp.]